MSLMKSPGSTVPAQDLPTIAEHGNATTDLEQHEQASYLKANGFPNGYRQTSQANAYGLSGNGRATQERKKSHDCERKRRLCQSRQSRG